MDADCYALTSATTRTGAGEIWRAPYDNRPAPSTTTNAQGSPNGGYPAGLLWPYVEGNQKIFKWPKSFDPATGQTYQFGDGMNDVNGGPNSKSLAMLTNGNGSSNILIVWDHGKTPGCADSTHAATPSKPRGPWPFPDTTSPKTHDPDQRHTNVLNFLSCGGHIAALTQAGLTEAGTVQFLATGTAPAYPRPGRLSRNRRALAGVELATAGYDEDAGHESVPG